MRRQPMTPWLVVLAMVGMAAAVDLDPTQIHSCFFTWMDRRRDEGSSEGMEDLCRSTGSAYASWRCSALFQPVAR